jgi:hypothetical protein
MAYGGIYYAGWASYRNQSGYLYIDQIDYTGGATQLKLIADSVSINYNFEDWNNPIIGMQMEFDIINDKVDFYELLPLLTAEESEYKIRFVVKTLTTTTALFEGFLNCDTITQKMLHKQIIKFAASSYLSKLDGLFVPSIDTLQNKTFIDIIDEILTSTGAIYNIRINCKLHAEGDIMGSAQTLFNKNGFYTELFWEDDVTRSSSLVVLKAILTSFDCYLYWKIGYWYIERYEDIWTESTDFVEYTTGQAYTPTSSGSITHIDQTISDVHSLVFTGQSQTLSVIPGLKTIKINLEDKRVFNLVVSTLKDATPTVADVPEPFYRKFLIYQVVIQGFYTGDIIWRNPGLPISNITNAIQRIQNHEVVVPSYRGISTCFRVTIDKDDVAVEIKFKYYIDLIKITGWTKKWSDYSLDFYWFLRIAGRNDYIVNSGEDWFTKVGSSDGVIDNEINGVMMMTNIPGSNFISSVKTVEISIIVPLGLVTTYFDGYSSGALSGDQTLIFGLGVERLHTPTDEDTIGNQVSDCYIGDFNITTTGGMQNNVIEANVSGARFLNKKDIPMTLYDMESYNYKNGILRGDSLTLRTERWGVLGGTTNIIQKGVCWSTSSNPTIANSLTNDGTGFETYVSQMNNLIRNTVYFVRAYTIDEDNHVTYGDEKTFTTEFIQIGDFHQGGRVFYFLQENDLGYDPLIRKGLIAATQDQGNTTFWASIDGGGSSVPGLSPYIGYGMANSILMDEDYKTSPYAVASCFDYETGVEPELYNDWYLPSKMELLQMYKQRSVIGGFKASWYWCSYEASADFALAMDFGNYKGTEYAADEDRFDLGVWKKNNYINVRAIRSFTET